MKICGLKLTHDGAVAGIENGKLVFCVEAEKLNNNPRYSRIDDMMVVSDILDEFNFIPDQYVVDGWKHSTIPVHNLPVASYHEHDGSHENLMDRMFTKIRPGCEGPESYSSFPHVTGHVLGAYCSAPFSKDLEDAYVITWDGGQNPRVHFVSPTRRRVEFVKSLHDMYGVIYGIMGRYFGPFKVEGIEHEAVSNLPLNVRFGGYEVPGKIMSYIALGTASSELVNKMMGMYYRSTQLHARDLGYHQDGMLEHHFMRSVLKEVNEHFPFLTDADVLRSVHTWLEVMLVDNAIAAIPKGANLAFAGGSALNIKWNSALRRTGHFKTVWVPPFPNDAGSAIGQACAMMASIQDIWTLDWSVYCGMPVPAAGLEDGWSASPCTIDQLAGFLVAHPECPVVFLNGRGEVGPRALGNRSIFMSTKLASNKDTLNRIKGRESFRPVAPICLESHAPVYFNPGTPDPYMLFDHTVYETFRDVVPAIVHIDGTARLQTVNEQQNKDVFDLLTAYYEMTGVPMLCNTSANGNGSGFFPDVESAMRWGKIKHIWSGGLMFIKEDN